MHPLRWNQGPDSRLYYCFLASPPLSLHSLPSLIHVWAQSCLTPCNHMDCSPPGSSVHGIFQARILEVGDSSRVSSQSRDWTHISWISFNGRQNLYHWATWEAQGVSHSVMSNSSSLPGSSVHGISQAIILEWVAISFSRGSSQARDQTWVSCIVGRFFTIWATRKASSLTD